LEWLSKQVRVIITNDASSSSFERLNVLEFNFMSWKQT